MEFEFFLGLLHMPKLRQAVSCFLPFSQDKWGSKLVGVEGRAGWLAGMASWSEWREVWESEGW